MNISSRTIIYPVAIASVAGIFFGLVTQDVFAGIVVWLVVGVIAVIAAVIAQAIIGQSRAPVLLNCPACGHQMSRYAKSCPGCGHVLGGATMMVVQVIGGIILVVVGLYAMSFLF